MKTFSSCILLVFCAFSWAVAQDLRPEAKVGDSLREAVGALPEVASAQGLPEETATELHEQDTATLDSKMPLEAPAEEIPEMDALREKSVYFTVMKKEVLPVSSVQGARLSRDLQKVSAVYRKTGEQEADCLVIADSVRQRVKKNPEIVLQLVDEEVKANPGCSCEIVKAAILESDMQVATVVAIVTVAFEASPENIRLIAQCAIAACPDALSEIQALLAKYEKANGTGDSAKSAKGEKASILSDDEVAATPNPLDFPGGPEGYNIPFIPPPNLIIIPPTTTLVDP